MKKINIAAVLLFTSIIACCTACGGSDSGNNQSAQSNSSAEQANSSVSVGYIVLNDEQNAADLYSDTDATTILSKMFDGEPISVYSIQGEWAEISYGGTRGFVNIENVTFTKSENDDNKTEKSKEESVSEESSQEKNSQTEPVATEKGNSGSPNITYVYLIDADGFRVAKPLSYSKYIAESSARNAWCSAQACYIYALADVNSEKREANMLYYGDELTVEGSIDDFYYISTDSGNGYDLHGYVKQSYITFGATPAAPENPNATHGCVNVGSANVRSSPNKETNNNVLFTLHNGDQFDVISYDGYWYQINYNGTVCYISHKMVEVW